MEKLRVENFGPISFCEIEISNFMAFIGEQASGKSTVAKCIYYCKHLRDILKDRLLNALVTMNYKGLYTDISKEARTTFLNLFGSTLYMEQFKIHYDYTSDMSVDISLSDNQNKYVDIKFNDSLNDEIQKLIKKVKLYCGELMEAEPPATLNSQSDRILYNSSQKAMAQQISEDADTLFNDSRHYLFIPSGRSIISTLTDSLESMYKEMKFIDTLTYKFINEMLDFKKRFRSIDQLLHIKKEIQYSDIPVKYAEYAMTLSKKILKGRYENAGGEERIFIQDTAKYVKINFASSGQQETVWIINLLFYYLVYNIDCQVFIEEPEAHLFPTAQQGIIRFIVNFFNAKPNNRVVIPTHSPYILSEINNLIYAEKIKSTYPNTASAVEKLVDKTVLLPHKQLSVYNVTDSGVSNILDDETTLIDFTKLDSPAATPINDLFDKLYDLEDEHSEN